MDNKDGQIYLDRIDMKFLTSDFCWLDNNPSGRYTDMVCNKVHEPRPISLTSGGHSLGFLVSSFFGPTFIKDLKSVHALHGFSRFRSYSILFWKVMQLLSFLHFCLQITQHFQKLSKPPLTIQFSIFFEKSCQNDRSSTLCNFNINKISRTFSWIIG